MFLPFLRLQSSRTPWLFLAGIVFLGPYPNQAVSESPHLRLREEAGLAEPVLGGTASVPSSLVPNVVVSTDAAKPGPKQPVRVAATDMAASDSPENKGKVEVDDDNSGEAVAKDSGNEKMDQLANRQDVRTAAKDILAKPLTPAEIETRDRLREALEAYQGWRLNSRDHSPWEVMHAIIAGGVGTRILQDGPHGEPVTAVGWICFNRPCGGRRILYLNGDGLGTMQGPGLEGHRGQLLAILAQSRVKSDYPIQVNGRSFRIADLIEYEKTTCYADTELTFKLIALNHYLDQDAQWQNDLGQSWSIPRLIREEIAQPIRGATCGGTHRLSGLSLAVKKRIYSGNPLDGEYARAAKYIRDYHAYTLSLQNRDGSLSTEWFRGRGSNPDPARRLQTTGHILEWLCYSLPDSEIRDPRIRAAVDYLAGLMLQHRTRTWDAGPLGHALHSLVLYDQRVFQVQEAADVRLTTKSGESSAVDASTR